MNFFSKLFKQKNSTPKLDEAQLVDAAVCPNCWGKMEYDNQYIDYVKDQTKSNINHDNTGKKAFVQQFVETHVTGIHLKKDGDHLSCPMCKGKYKKVSNKAN